MAVHAQYPSNYLLFNNNRNEQETKDRMDYSQQQQPPPPLFLYNTGVNINGDRPRKGVREIASFQMVPTPPQPNLLSPPSMIQSPPFINLPQLQVPTGLRLSPFEDFNNNNIHQSQNQEEDLSSLVSQQKLEIEQYLLTQGEQLRRTLAEKHGALYRELMVAAEETATRKLKEKEVELSRAAKKTVELEDQISRLRTEALRWQAKAMSDQSVAESLHARIRQASKRPERAEAGSAAVVEDSESAYVDPNRVEQCGRTCRACGLSEVSVVVLPCRHLCLCISCDAADSGVFSCPVCHVVKAGSVQVRLS